MKNILKLGLLLTALTISTNSVALADSAYDGYAEPSYKPQVTKAVKKAKPASSESRLSSNDAEFAADYKKRSAKEGYVRDRDCSCRGSAYCSCAPSAGDGYYGGYGYGYGYGYDFDRGFGSAEGAWHGAW